MAKFIDLEKGELLFAEGDPGNNMFVVLEGKLQAFLSQEQSKVVLTTLEKGQFFGEMSLLENEPRSASVEALEPTKVMVIHEDNFQKCICENPDLAFKIMKGLSNRLRISNEQVFTLRKIVKRMEEDNRKA